MKSPIAITAFSSLSALGNTSLVHEGYRTAATCISPKAYDGKTYLTASIPATQRQQLDVLRQSEHRYKNLDDTVLMAILVAREAIQKAGWGLGDSFGVNFGSSRGATQLIEKYHKEFLETGTTATLTSPTTTLGNISSWVAHDLKTIGPDISHSITCSTALHAVLNAIAWLEAGMADTFLVGGSEAPLTPFTLAQMQALKIYASGNAEYPCRSLDLDKKQNTMVLGEAAAAACLEKGVYAGALGYISGFGYATDTLEHDISISEEAECFQQSMKMALQATALDDVDVIVMHAPGTVKGDMSEYKAIQKVFGDQLPLLTTNKWKVGHTFGASGMLSLELALLMLREDCFYGVPFGPIQAQRKPIQNVLVNAVGFGGNAVSLLITNKL